MKFFFNILSICAICSSFGAFKAVGNELDEVICNAMKGMQSQEEKKIPYNIGDFELIGITVDCKKKALVTEKKHIQYSLSDFSEDFKINATKNWKNANCKNMIFNTNTGWSTTQIIKDVNKNVVLKLEANFEICSQ
tara:strand:+ start:253 stop:660 length:408 start_codon:yes stop_codon:yes gene_type:complete